MRIISAARTGRSRPQQAGADRQTAKLRQWPAGIGGRPRLCDGYRPADRRSDDAAGASRFALLDTIRTYGAERLDASGEGSLLRDRHLAAYLALAERAAAELSGPEQRAWLDRLEADADNFRAALDRAEAVPDPEAAGRLGFALWRFWQQRGYLREARQRLAAFEAHGWDLAPRTHARLLEALGGVAYWLADFDAAQTCYGL